MTATTSLDFILGRIRGLGDAYEGLRQFVGHDWTPAAPARRGDGDPPIPICADVVDLMSEIEQGVLWCYGSACLLLRWSAPAGRPPETHRRYVWARNLIASLGTAWQGLLAARPAEEAAQLQVAELLGEIERAVPWWLRRARYLLGEELRLVRLAPPGEIPCPEPECPANCLWLDRRDGSIFCGNPACRRRWSFDERELLGQLVKTLAEEREREEPGMEEARTA